MHRIGLSVVSCVLLLSFNASAQILNRLNFGGGGGFSVPSERAGRNLDTVGTSTLVVV
jgi:hypothetical protein